jgi:methyl-accepting chemotaxis protein
MGIEITNEMIERAKQEADKREKYIEHHFSVEHLTDDKRNIIGFLGEFACCELLGVDWKKNIRSDYLTIDSGDINIGDYLIDVKTETIPQPYFNEVFNRRINDDKAYGRRLITEEQIPLLAKYNIVIFGAFVREKYNKWYALGYLETSYITNMEERIKAMDNIRAVTRELIEIQTQGCSEKELAEKQKVLNERYDVFAKKYGSIAERENSRAFRNDADYPLLCSLEVVDEDGIAKKADMFYKQTIKPKVQIERVETAVEALNVSMNEYGSVNIPFMLSIYHPDVSKAMAELPEGSSLSEHARAELERGIMIEELKGIIYLNPMAYNENNLKGIPTSEVMKIVNGVLLILVVITIVTVIVALIIAIIVGKTISKPILEVVRATEIIKEGDFTVQVQSKSKDETKLLADALNAMTRNVQNLIREAKLVSKEMVDSASGLAAITEETNATVEQVASTVGEIAKGTQDTAASAEKGAVATQIIDQKFTSLMDSNQHMLKNVQEAANMNEVGMQALTLLKEKSAISNQSNEKVAEAIKSLDIRVNAITNIVDAITSIANQTNLLALNASIEAARAGEAGRGFAVVAEEIRKLAEDSGKATEEIRGIVASIQTESTETVQIVSEVGKIAKEQNGAVENMNQSFVKIYEAVENITKVIEVITHEVDELNVQKNEIVEITSAISAVSEQTAAATEEVSSSMDEQTRAIEEVAKSAEHLNELSMELNQQIEIFKI